MLRVALLRFAIPICASCVIGLGSAVITGLVFNAQMESRVTHIEVQMQKHEKVLERDFGRQEQLASSLSMRTDDQERRITRLETLMDEVNSTLKEIRADVKTIMRGK